MNQSKMIRQLGVGGQQDATLKGRNYAVKQYNEFIKFENEKEKDISKHLFEFEKCSKIFFANEEIYRRFSYYRRFRRKCR